MLRFTARARAAGRTHLRHTFEKMPVGGRFYLRSGKTLYVKTGARKYRHADAKTGSFEYTIGRVDTVVRYPGAADDARARGALHRDNDGQTRRRGKGGRFAGVKEPKHALYGVFTSRGALEGAFTSRAAAEKYAGQLKREFGEKFTTRPLPPGGWSGPTT